MRLGLYMDLRNPAGSGRPWDGFYADALERVREAERLGLDSVWFTEHHFWEDGYLPQPLTMATAAAAVTERITLGTAVVLAPLHSAVDIAEQASLVDHISGGGRFQLGLGAGYCVPEFRAYGADRGKRFEALEQKVAEVRRLWSEGVVTPSPLSERIPIWVGGSGPRAARIAARTGEGLLWNAPDVHDAFREALAKLGRDPAEARLSGLVNLVISDDPERAWSRIAPHLAYQLETYGYYGNPELESWDEPPRLGRGPAGGEQELDPEALRSAGPVMLPPQFDVVTPEEAVRRMREWLAPLPVENLFFWERIGGMDEDLVRRHVELLASEVAPALRSAP